MMTKIKLSYYPHEGPCNEDNRISIDPKLVEAWMAHHASIGLEHFNIYDNADEPRGILETILQPYVQSGIVTYVWYAQVGLYCRLRNGRKACGGSLHDWSSRGIDRGLASV